MSFHGRISMLMFASFVLQIAFWAVHADLKYSFAKEASQAIESKQYDYIIVGGGATGCPLAATLSQRFSVLLLERGGVPYGVPSLEHISGFHENLINFDKYTSPAQGFRSEDGVGCHRARVLGGGTALNAGFYTKAPPQFVTKQGWDDYLVNQSYQWVENKVVFQPILPLWQSALKKALVEAGVGPDNGFTYDHVQGTKIGGTIFDQSGQRHTAADLLEYAVPENIEVLIHATAHRILFHSNQGAKPRAYGVEFMDNNGHMHTALLKSNRGDVILSAGALGSPQLLLLSGVGPAADLKAMDIPVVLDLPGVGKSMGDNPNNVFSSPGSMKLDYSLVNVVAITKYGSYIEEMSGGSSTTGLIQVFLNMIKDPTMLISPLSMGVIETLPQNVKDHLSQVSYVFSKISGPASRGELHLATRDPRDNPRVRFNYYSDPRDLNACVEGIKVIGKAFQSEAFQEFTYSSVLNAPQNMQLLMQSMAGFMVPDSSVGDQVLAQVCKNSVVSIWHTHGGCLSGNVITPSDHRVIGVDSLRVVDMSTLDETPGANPQATLMMLGRYMGLKILASA